MILRVLKDSMHFGYGDRDIGSLLLQGKVKANLGETSQYKVPVLHL